MSEDPGSDIAATDDQLRIQRKLNLDLAEDRQELVAALMSRPPLKKLAEDHIDDFLRWFKAPEWHVVYSGGLMSGPEPGGRHSRMGSSIERLLDITVKLGSLQRYRGFDKLISGLNNPSQVGSTIFEIEVAAWCAMRLHHEALIFSPTVTKRSGVKYPDFLWLTTLGNLYCECKQLNMWQRRETQRTATLMSVAAEKMGDPALWPKEVRMEVLLHGRFTRSAEDQLKAIVEQQASEVRRGLRPSPFQCDTFTIAVRDRSDSQLELPDSISVYQVQVGPVPIQINDFRSAHLIVTRSIGLTRSRALRDFVKEAKDQLPDDGPGGVFIELPGGIDIAAQKLQEMLARPAHQAVSWSSIWTAGTPVRAVWRNGQAFDARLVDGRER